jgi:hypothetical protein
MMYQGPDYEDPNPPEEVIPDPKAKKPPAKGAPPVPDEPAPPRMITPAPVVMEKESGRTFRIELGRMEKEPLSHEPSQELEPEKSTEKVAPSGKDSKNAVVTQNASALSVQEPTENMIWHRYYANQFKSEEDQFEFFNSKEGVCMIEGIKFNVNDDLGIRTVKAGTYELRISESTKGLPLRMRVKNAKVLLKLVDLDEEAAIAAAAAEAGKQEKKGPGGKKK